MYSRAYKTLVSLPPLLWVGLFLLLPYALMFAHSFWAVHEGVLVHQWNLHNYVTLFSKPVYLGVLLRTMRIAASVTLCSRSEERRVGKESRKRGAPMPRKRETQYCD